MASYDIYGPAPNTSPITVINKLIASADNVFTNYRANQGIRQYKIALLKAAIPFQGFLTIRAYVVLFVSDKMFHH